MQNENIVLFLWGRETSRQIFFCVAVKKTNELGEARRGHGEGVFLGPVGPGLRDDRAEARPEGFGDRRGGEEAGGPGGELLPRRGARRPGRSPRRGLLHGGPVARWPSRTPWPSSRPACTTTCSASRTGSTSRPRSNCPGWATARRRSPGGRTLRRRGDAVPRRRASWTCARAEDVFTCAAFGKQRILPETPGRGAMVPPTVLIPDEGWERNRTLAAVLSRPVAPRKTLPPTGFRPGYRCPTCGWSATAWTIAGRRGIGPHLFAVPKEDGLPCSPDDTRPISQNREAWRSSAAPSRSTCSPTSSRTIRADRRQFDAFVAIGRTEQKFGRKKRVPPFQHQGRIALLYDDDCRFNESPE